MENDVILQNLVRIGTVSAIDPITRKARVIFPDKDFTSGWLYVLRYPGFGITLEDAGGHSHDITGGGTTDTAGIHTHTVIMADWMPEIDDRVLISLPTRFQRRWFHPGGDLNVRRVSRGYRVSGILGKN